MVDSLKPIDAATAARLRDRGALMVDIREPGEFARSRIPMSTNLPLSRLETTALPVGASQPVVFFCAGGNRTTVAARRLATKAGSADAYVMDGGLSTWKRAGLPLESGRAEDEEGRGTGRGFFSRWLGL